MSKQEKTNIEIEVENTIKALIIGTKPINNALKELDKEFEATRSSEHLIKLPRLMGHLTSVSKRKTINKKLSLDGFGLDLNKNNEITIGLNCNGIGYTSWGTQLSSLCTANYFQENHEDYKILMAIFNDEELCLEIADEILSRNRKNFMKLAVFFRNTTQAQGVITAEEEEDEDDEKIKNAVGGRVTFLSEGGVKSFIINGESLGWKIKSFIENGEKSRTSYEDLEVKDLFKVKYILEYVDGITASIKAKKDVLEENRKRNRNKDIFVTDMIKPYEALEKL